MSAASPPPPPPPLATSQGCAQALPPHLAALLNDWAAAAAQASAAVALPTSDDSLAANSGAAEAADVGAASSDAATACPQDDAQPEEAAQSELAGASSHGVSRPSFRASLARSSCVSGPIDQEDNARHGPAPSEGKEEQDDPGNTRPGAQGSAREAAAHSSTREVASAGASATAAAVESLLALSGMGTAPEAGACLLKGIAEGTKPSTRKQPGSTILLHHRHAHAYTEAGKYVASALSVTSGSSRPGFANWDEEAIQDQSSQSIKLLFITAGPM